MKILKYSLIALLFTFAAKPYSQEIVVSLKQAIQNAYKNDPNIIKTENTIEAQESNIRASYGNLYPDLKLNAGWTRSNQVIEEGNYFINGIITPIKASNTTGNNYNLNLRSDVTIFDGLANLDRVDLAEQTQSQYKIQLQNLKQDIALNVIASYISVLKNEQVVVINQSNLEDSRAQLEKIKIFVEVGRRTLTDVYNQDVTVSQNELAVEQSRNNLNKSISDLAFVANLPLDRSYAVIRSEFNTDLTFGELDSYVTQNSNSDLLTAGALKNRYDYKSKVQNLDVLQSSIDIARGSLIFPTITGFGSYSLTGTRLSDVSKQRVFNIGLTLSYPIFQGFSLDNQRQQAIINYRSAEEDIKLVKNQISLEIKKAILDLKSLLKQIEITERTLKSAEQNKYLAEESYRVGIGTLIDVNTASVNLNNLLINKSNIIYDFILAQKRLEYYQGILRY